MLSSSDSLRTIYSSARVVATSPTCVASQRVRWPQSRDRRQTRGGYVIRGTGNATGCIVLFFTNSSAGLWIAAEFLIVTHSFTGNSVSFGSLAHGCDCLVIYLPKGRMHATPILYASVRLPLHVFCCNNFNIALINGYHEEKHCGVVVRHLHGATIVFHFKWPFCRVGDSRYCLAIHQQGNLRNDFLCSTRNKDDPGQQDTFGSVLLQPLPRGHHNGIVKEQNVLAVLFSRSHTT